LIGKVGPTDLPVLIQGPTGSGKELVAHALHAASGRGGRLVAFNVCAIPETLLEAAVFGHTRGGFTGASQDLPGYLAEADRGTAFFDEISGLPLALQPKLLRALETCDFRPVGARGDRHSDFRLVSATNDQLDGLVARGQFRADLAYRLRAVVMTVPALNERLQDVPLLADYFLRRALKTDRTEQAVQAAALDVLLDFDWPGNVRELRHVIETALALSGGQTLGVEEVREALSYGSKTELHESGGDPRGQLIATLDRVEWDTAAAARELRVHRATVYRWMRRLRISPSRCRHVGFASIRANSHPFAANPAGLR